MCSPTPRSTLFPYTTLFRSAREVARLPVEDALEEGGEAGEDYLVIGVPAAGDFPGRSEEHTSELQSRPQLVCRLLLEKTKTVGHQGCRPCSRASPSSRA